MLKNKCLFTFAPFKRSNNNFHISVTLLRLFKPCLYLEGDLELCCSLGVPSGLIGGSLDLDRHGEDWSVDGARLGQQAVLQPRPDLVQAHQGVHWLVGVYGFTIQDYGKK